MKKEIKILGAGISGLSAAINLAKAGYKVTVYEKNKDCGMRFHGDFQGLENWSVEKNVLEELKEMNINTDFWNRPTKKICFLDYKNKRFPESSKRVLFYIVKRGNIKGSLDQSLKKQALDAGVKIVFKSKISPKEVDIISTGPRKAMGIAKGISFTTDHKNILIAQLNDQTSYLAYSWMFLIDDKGIIVTGSPDQFANIKNEFMMAKNNLLRYFNLKLKNVREWSNFGNFSLNGPYTLNKKLYTGEAAGLQDYLWGFGMRSSFVSGYLAARSIIEKRNYKKMIKQRYSNYLKTSVVNRYIWEHLGNKGYEGLLKFTRLHEDIFLALNLAYRYNVFKKLLFPIAYSKLKKRGIYRINHKN